MQPCNKPRTKVGRSAASALLTTATLLLALSPVEAKPPFPPTAWDALRHFTQQRAFPRKAIDFSAYEAARAQQARMPGLTPEMLSRQRGANANGSRTALPSGRGAMWTYVGPTNLAGPGPFGFGPELAIGRVNSATYDPLNTNIIYITAPTGGVWKTSDGGVSWTPLTDHLHAGIGFSSVVVDPVNDQNVYAGSGDYDGTYALGFGLWKSTQGGAPGTWKRIDIAAGNRPIFGRHCIRKIVIDPNDATGKTLLVALGRDQTLDQVLGGSPLPNGYVYRSTDGGTTWTKVLATPGWVDNIVTNSNHTAYYAAVDYVGLYKSGDGIHWTQLKSINAGVTQPLQSFAYRMDVAASVLDPNTVFVLSEAARKVYKSTDGGHTFQDSTHNLPANFAFNNQSTWSQGFYDFHIETSKATLSTTGQTKEVVYIGLLDLYQSVDSGTTWASIARVYTGEDLTHTDQHGATVNPNNPNELLISNDGGVYRFNYVPETNNFTFTSLNAQLGITEFYSSAYSPVDPSDIISGAQDESTPVTYLGPSGSLNAWFGVLSGDGCFGAVSAVQPNPEDHIIGVPLGAYGTRYVSTQFAGQLVQTDDFWASQLNIAPAIPPTEPTQFVVPLQISQASPNDIYIGSNHLYHYVHKDPTWNCTANPPTYVLNAGTWTTSTQQLGIDAIDRITAISPSPTNAGVVYAGTLEGAIYVSGTAGFDTAGSKYIRVDNQGNANGLPARTITHIEVSPLNPQRIYVTLSGTGLPNGHVYRCDDVTAISPIWIPIGQGIPDVPANWMVLIPHDDEQEWWVATDIGVFYTLNNGKTIYQSESIGLPGVPVNQLTYIPTTGNLEAATYGRGLWRINIGSDVQFQLFPRLQYYIGNKTRLAATLKFYHTNQPVIADPRTPALGACIDWDPFRLVTAPTEIRTGTLSPAGWLNMNISARGNYDIYLQVYNVGSTQAGHFLRKRVRHVLTGDKPIISDVLINGDVTGSYDKTKKAYLPPDNVIDSNDLLWEIGAAALGYQDGAIGDLNGDGKIDGTDIAIINSNLGKVGD